MMVFRQIFRHSARAKVIMASIMAYRMRTPVLLPPKHGKTTKQTGSIKTSKIQRVCHTLSRSFRLYERKIFTAPDVSGEKVVFSRRFCCLQYSEVYNRMCADEIERYTGKSRYIVFRGGKPAKKARSVKNKS